MKLQQKKQPIVEPIILQTSLKQNKPVPLNPEEEDVKECAKTNTKRYSISASKPYF